MLSRINACRTALLVSLLSLATASVAAPDLSPSTSAQQGGIEETGRDSRALGPLGVTAIVHVFDSDSMDEAYGAMYGAGFQAGRRLGSRADLRLDSGILIAVGDPALPDPTWEVESSSLELAVLPLGASLVFGLPGRGSIRTLAPYFGGGLRGYFGFERTSVILSRVPEGRFDWNDTRFRYGGGVHALAGIAVKLESGTHLLVELSATLGVEGSDVDQSFSEEEIRQGWLEVAAAVQRPDFDFTGFGLSVGVQW